MSKQKEIKALQKAIKDFKQLDDKAKHSRNEDDAYTNIWDDIADKANDLDDKYMHLDYSCLDDDLEDNGDIENGDDMQDFIIERLADKDSDDFINNLKWLEAGAKAEYEDVLYIMNFDDPSDVREVTADDIDDTISDIIYDIENQIKADRKPASGKEA